MLSDAIHTSGPFLQSQLWYKRIRGTGSGSPIHLGGTHWDPRVQLSRGGEDIGDRRQELMKSSITRHFSPRGREEGNPTPKHALHYSKYVGMRGAALEINWDGAYQPQSYIAHVRCNQQPPLDGQSRCSLAVRHGGLEGAWLSPWADGYWNTHDIPQTNSWTKIVFKKLLTLNV